jgi:ABC-type phosphate transport system permease subunit
LLNPLLAGGGMATDRDEDDDRPLELNENDILSFVLLLCILKLVVMLVVAVLMIILSWDQLTMTGSSQTVCGTEWMSSYFEFAKN